MTERILINRNELYLTIDNVRIETEKGIEEKNNQFIAFFKDTPPNELNYGEQLKDKNGRNIVFPSFESAKDYAFSLLKKIVYPPNFLHPLRYKKEDLDEILHKRLIFDIGSNNNENISETIEGVMVSCSLAANPPYLPGIATITKNDGQEKKLTFFEIKQIRKY
jgi:hypothetical protein